MRIELERITTEPERFETVVELAPEAVDESALAGPMTVTLKGEVVPHDGGHLLRGEFSCTGTLACTRCLEAVPWEAAETMSLELRRPEELEGRDEVDLDEEDLDVTFLEDPVLDLKQLAIEQVALALPMRFVCTEECAGLCPRCGGNRNQADGCSCEPEADSRWEALKGLKGHSA